MRCKKHTADFSSTVGVCASCLRERLFVLIAAQAEAHQKEAQLPRAESRAALSEDPRKSDPTLPPPPLVFPRSVSPYVARRKSDESTWQHNTSQDRRFYSTPQVGPTYAGANTFATVEACRKKSGRFSLLTKLFRTRSEKIESDPRVSSRESCEPVVGADLFFFFFPLVHRDLLRQPEKEFAALRPRRTLCPREQKASPNSRSRNVSCKDCGFGQRMRSISVCQRVLFGVVEVSGLPCSPGSAGTHPERVRNGVLPEPACESEP